jgi:hypothetical protein
LLGFLSYNILKQSQYNTLVSSQEKVDWVLGFESNVDSSKNSIA